MHRLHPGWLLALIAPVLTAAIPLQPPPPLALTAEEEAELAAGEIVIRMDRGSETGGGAIGVVDVEATPEAALAALMDLGARVGEVGGLKAVETYLDEPGRLGVRWELKVLTFPVVFHNLYTIDQSRGWVRYSLDPSRENGLAAVEGSYQVYPVPGGARIVYHSETDSGRPVPQWVKRWLATGALKEQLRGVERRAEARP